MNYLLLSSSCCFPIPVHGADHMNQFFPVPCAMSSASSMGTPYCFRLCAMTSSYQVWGLPRGRVQQAGTSSALLQCEVPTTTNRLSTHPGETLLLQN